MKFIDPAERRGRCGRRRRSARAAPGMVKLQASNRASWLSRLLLTLQAANHDMTTHGTTPQDEFLRHRCVRVSTSSSTRGRAMTCEGCQRYHLQLKVRPHSRGSHCRNRLGRSSARRRVRSDEALAESPADRAHGRALLRVCRRAAACVVLGRIRPVSRRAAVHAPQERARVRLITNLDGEIRSLMSVESDEQWFMTVHHELGHR